jgi:hypothetical protein
VGRVCRRSPAPTDSAAAGPTEPEHTRMVMPKAYSTVRERQMTGTLTREPAGDHRPVRCWQSRTYVRLTPRR